MGPETIAERLRRLAEIAEDKGDFKLSAELAIKADIATREAIKEKQDAGEQGSSSRGLITVFDLIEAEAEDLAAQEALEAEEREEQALKARLADLEAKKQGGTDE